MENFFEEYELLDPNQDDHADTQYCSEISENLPYSPRLSHFDFWGQFAFNFDNFGVDWLDHNSSETSSFVDSDNVDVCGDNIDALKAEIEEYGDEDQFSDDFPNIDFSVDQKITAEIQNAITHYFDDK